jgi:Ca2+-binding RTX toxin-like protein
MENSSDGLLTVAVNHLKSKGSACAGDPDLGDGQGNCNLTRLGAAEALVDWLASDPTGSGDTDFLIIGDLNSYDKEDPIDAIQAGSDDTAATDDDYTDLIAAFNGELAYGYVFDGQLGYLDHGLSSSSLTPQVVNAVEWHINADEPDLLDYNTDFKLPAQQAIYEPNAYRSSDHDPVIVSLDLVGLADIQVLDFSADGYTTLTLTYEVLTSTVSPFAVDFYTSTDSLYDGGDSLLSTAVVNNPADLTVGVHVVTFDLGVDADLVSDANESNNDYFVLAVADVTDVVAEEDSDPHNEDNTAVFHGAYKYSGATNVFVHGTAAADTVFAGSNNLSLNGTGYLYGSAIGLRIRVHAENDVVSSNFNGPVALFGGPGNDQLSGGSKPDYIDGGEGDDTLRGNASPDPLLGGPGNDLLIGGRGDGWLNGG